MILRNEHWADLVREYSQPGTFFYLDPPYRDKERYYSNVEYDPYFFEAYWLCQFDGASNADNRDMWPELANTDEPPEFVEWDVYQEAEEDYTYGGPNSPVDVMISSRQRLEPLEPFTTTIGVDATHEINNTDSNGGKEVVEYLTMNYDPFADDFSQFGAGDDTSLGRFG